MEMTVGRFQQWLNDHGASPKLVIDNKGGPATRAAVVQVFKNCDAPAATAEDIARTATLIGSGTTQKQLSAFASVESGGFAWDDDCLLKALYERHYFWQRIKIAIPWISNPKGGDYTIDANRNGINDSWEKIALAACRNPVAAFESASFGKFQIMGAHAKRMGYANAIEFAWALSRGEAAHYEALARFLRVEGLGPLMAKVSRNPDDNKPIALRYNGKLGVQRGYHSKIAQAMRA